MCLQVDQPGGHFPVVLNTARQQLLRELSSEQVKQEPCLPVVRAAQLTWHAGGQVCKAHVREEPYAALWHCKHGLLRYHSDVPVC